MPVQRVALVGTVVFGAAPLTVGRFRYARTGCTPRPFRMALVATVFAAGVPAVALRRSPGVATECVVYSSVPPGYAA